MANANEASSSVPSVPTERTGVVLNNNDVLCGRGLGASKFIGNKRFRDLVDIRRQEYTSEDSYNDKAVIAKEVFMVIRSRGGRFLKMVSLKTEKPARFVVTRGVWEETDVKSALEKCKQALREKQVPTNGGGAKRRRKKKGTKGSSKGTTSAESEARLSSPAAAHPESNAPAGFSSLGSNGDIPSSPMTMERFVHIQPSKASVPPSSSISEPTTFLGSTVPSTVDSRLLLFQNDLASALQLSLVQQQQMAMGTVYPLQVHHSLQTQGGNAYTPTDRMPQAIQQGLYERYLESRVLHLQSQDLSLRQPDAATLEHRHPSTSFNWKDDQDSPEHPSVSSNEVPPTLESVREDAVFALSALAVCDRPRFTAREEEMEMATMTDEERLAALSDLFGEMCSVSNHQKKRARKDLDRDSIDFLVEYMRVEIEQIPVDKKLALVEAQAKCLPDEFSNERLERFLRCEGMNAKLGAERFVKYWKCRRELFGPDKYLQRMTLSEALRDDLVALNSGFYRLLPHCDSSGRQLVLLEPRRNTGEGYTPESMLRAIWYTAEVAAEACTDIGSGFIYIGWNKDSSVFDFDAKVYGRLSHFENTCWPIKFIAAHMCGASSTISRIVKPLMQALMDRRGRSRMVIHNASESEILEELSAYGILEDMLPTEMEGNVELSQSEWIANRHAAELEEL